MPSRVVTVLSVLGAVMLFGMAVLHGSGYPYVAGTVQASDLPEFLKTVLPPLYLYPSVLMAILGLAVLASLAQRAVQAPVLGLVAAVVGMNSILGFLLGGAIPGGVLLVAASLFGFASIKARATSVDA